jgi:hypothetical protein
MPTAVKTDPKRTARLQRELYPLPPDIRAHLVQATLAICGLEIQEDGQVTAIPPTAGQRKTSVRDKLAAMRILASFERNVLVQQRFDLAMEERGLQEDVPVVDNLPPITSEIADKALILIQEETDKKQEAQALQPEPDWRQPPTPTEPEDDEARWPITTPVREAIIRLALSFCGLQATPEGTAEPSGQRPAKPRIVLGAMRVLARLDLLALQQKRVRYLGATRKLRESRRHQFVMDPEIARKANALIHDERVKLLARIEAGDAEALAEANEAAADARRAALGRPY